MTTMDFDRLFDESADRQIAERLGDGWLPTHRQELTGVADLEHRGAGLLIHLSHERTARQLLLEFIDPATDGGFRLAVDYGDRLGAVLDVLAERADRVDTETAGDLVDEIARACPDTYLEPPDAGEDDEWERVVPED